MATIDSLRSALSSALTGIHKGFEKANKAASEISDFSRKLESGHDVVKPLVDLKLAEKDIKANRKVINIVDKMEDEILDIIA